jgi:hypothetical protein
MRTTNLIFKKAITFLFVILYACISNNVDAQDTKLTLKKSFTNSGGNLVTVDTWNEVQKSDLTYDDIKTLKERSKKNPKLQETYSRSGGDLVTVGSSSEIQKSDIS